MAKVLGEKNYVTFVVAKKRHFPSVNSRPSNLAGRLPNNPIRTCMPRETLYDNRFMAEDSFKDFVLDQLSALPEVRSKPMFGAHGLYQGEHFFAILDEGRLFFKTDAQSQEDYLARGMEPFSYESKGRTLTMSYYEVPPDVLENPAELAVWARRAILVAAARTGKGPKRRKHP